MPRKAKPKPDQPVRAPTDQAYGVRGDQVSAQQAMPIPQMRQGPPAAQAPQPTAAMGAPGPGAVPGGGGAPGPTSPDQMQMLMEAAMAAESPEGNALDGPTARPHEAVTSGLSQGPGPGPEALQGYRPKARPTPTANMLFLLADTTGDEKIRQMAQRAQRRGI